MYSRFKKALVAVSICLYTLGFVGCAQIEQPAPSVQNYTQEVTLPRSGLLVTLDFGAEEPKVGTLKIDVSVKEAQGRNDLQRLGYTISSLTPEVRVVMDCCGSEWLGAFEKAPSMKLHEKMKWTSTATVKRAGNYTVEVILKDSLGVEIERESAKIQIKG